MNANNIFIGAPVERQRVGGGRRGTVIEILGGAAIIAASVARPERPIHAITSDIWACFPQLNTRGHS